MKDIVTKTIGGVLAGVILYFLTDKYLSRDGHQPEQITPIAGDTVQVGSDEQTPSVDDDELSGSSSMQNQGFQKIPALEDLGPSRSEVNKPVEEMSTMSHQPVERATTSSPSQLPQKSVEEEMAMIEKQARAKRDSLSKDSLLNAQAKKVNKRAADVFDELEDETDEKKPPLGN